jgi:anti-sigma factor RsiW
MMADRHPDELDLLDLVEDELPRAAQDATAAHVEGCARCAESVRRLRAGRGALHSSGVLQLSERARDGISAAIDSEPRLRAQRSRYWEPRRLGLVVALTVVFVASALAVAQWRDGGDEVGGEAASEVAEDRGAEGAGGADASTQGSASGEERLFADPVQVAGPARAVAADLRAQGFEARVAGGEVVVRVESSAEAGRLRETLAPREPGPVVVRVEEPGG